MRRVEVLVDREWLPLDDPPPMFKTPTLAVSSGGWTATFGSVTHSKHGQVWVSLGSFPVRVSPLEYPDA